MKIYLILHMSFSVSSAKQGHYTTQKMEPWSTRIWIDLKLIWKDKERKLCKKCKISYFRQIENDHFIIAKKFFLDDVLSYWLFIHFS